MCQAAGVGRELLRAVVAVVELGIVGVVLDDARRHDALHGIGALISARLDKCPTVRLLPKSPRAVLTSDKPGGVYYGVK